MSPPLHPAAPMLPPGVTTPAQQVETGPQLPVCPCNPSPAARPLRCALPFLAPLLCGRSCVKWGKRRPGAHLTQTVFLGSSPVRAQDPALPRAGCEGTARRHWTRAKGQVVGCPTKVSLTMWSESTWLVSELQVPPGNPYPGTRGRVGQGHSWKAAPSGGCACHP